MRHPSEGELLALIDGALDAEATGRLRAHLAGCDGCRQGVRALEQAMQGVAVELALLDAGEPAQWREVAAAPRPSFAHEAVRATGDGAPSRRPTPRWNSPRQGTQAPESRTRPAHAGARWVRTPARWAAAVLLLAASGAAAMVVPRWAGWRTDAPVREGAGIAPSTEAPAPAAAATSAAAVSILPEQGRALIALATGPAGGAPTLAGATAVDNLDAAGVGRVRVQVSDRLDVQVTVTTPLAPAHAAPRFASAEGRLDVQLPARDAGVLVELPATLRSARVTLDGRAIVVVEGGAVQPAQATGAGVLLAPAARP